MKYLLITLLLIAGCHDLDELESDAERTKTQLTTDDMLDHYCNALDDCGISNDVCLNSDLEYPLENNETDIDSPNFDLCVQSSAAIKCDDEFKIIIVPSDCWVANDKAVIVGNSGSDWIVR